MNHGHVLDSARYALSARRFYVTVFIECVFTECFVNVVLARAYVVSVSGRWVWCVFCCLNARKFALASRRMPRHIRELFKYAGAKFERPFTKESQTITKMVTKPLLVPTFFCFTHKLVALFAV